MEEKFKKIKEIVIKGPDYKYEGELDWETLKSIIISVEELTKKIYDIRSFQQKAFHALVEMLQNAYRYKVDKTKAHLYVKESRDKLYILTENTLSLEDLANLKYLIEIINGLSQDELKAIKTEQLTTGKIEPHFKKYNGMMSIRRRTGNKLLYNFSKNDEKNSMVSLIITIDIK